MDWQWLVDRYFLKISGWENKCLSMGGHFTSVQAVIIQLSVYWAHLFQLHVAIINKLDGIKTNFIWSSMKHQKKYHLSKL